MKFKRAGLANAVAAVTAGVLLLATGGAGAAERGFYVAGDVGQSSYNLSKSDFDAVSEAAAAEAGLTIVDGNSSFDKTPIGFDLAVGYGFAPQFAVEAAYLSLGTGKYDSTVTLTDGSVTFDSDLGIGAKSSGPALSLIGSLPLGESLSLDGRVGAYFSKTRLKLSIAASGLSDSASDSHNDTGLLVGIGGSWSFNPAMAVRIGYTLYKDAVWGEDDIKQFSVGFRYFFLVKN